MLVVGSQLRKDHPLIAARLRQAARKGTQVSLLHCLDDELLIKLQREARSLRPPRCRRRWREVVRAAAQLKQA